MTRQDGKEISLKGIVASHGLAIGPAYIFKPSDLSIPPRDQESLEQELNRFEVAIKQARMELIELRNLLNQRAGQEQSDIISAHLSMLDDPHLAQMVREGVKSGKIIELAVQQAIEELAGILTSMSDPLFAERSLDVQDVGDRILRILLGVSDSSLNNLKVPSIIIAEDLSPSDTARLDPQFTLGFCTSSGGLTSHSAILARAMGIPAIVAMGENLQKYILTGTPLVLDGWQGNLIIDPGESTILNFYESKERHALRHAQISQDAQQPAQTADGYFVEVSANISNVESARQAIANGTEGIGLLRTEFLYLHDTRPPEEETQIKIYKEIFEIIGQKPIIIRTLDIGGDKPPSYLTFPIEMNPFLGWRAIRVSLDQPDLFKTQLRAILRAGFGYDVRIMFPMIIDLEEILRARQLFEQAQAELRNEKLDFKSNMQVGIMIETPAAAMIVDILADHVDFFSLGTNDLTQYTLAVDRGNAHIADRYQPLHPSVLRLIKQSIEMAHAKGKWVGMCGEMAGMLEAIPVLLGLGLDEVSVNPQTIPEVKYLIRQLTKDHTQRINEHVFGLNSVMEIKTYLNERLREFM